MYVEGGISMKNFKRIIIALIVACVITASIPVSGSVVDAATIKVKSGADVTKVERSGKKYVAYRGKQAVKPEKGWYKKGSTQYYFDGKENYATYVWYKNSGKWYLKKWNKSKKVYKKYTGTKRLSNDKSYYFNKGKKASGVAKVSGKYYYYKGGKQTVYSKSCDKWKTGKTQYYFGKGNKSATYVYYSDKKTLKKWNKTKKSYQKYTGVFTLSDGKTYRFSIGKRGTIKSSVTAGSKNTTAVYKDASNKLVKITGWKQVKGVQYYFNKAAVASFKIEKDVCYVFVAEIGEQSTDNLDINGTWKKYSGVVGRDYYVNGKVKPAEKDTITTDQSGLRIKWDGKKWKKFTGTYKKLYYVNGDYASGIVDGKFYRSGKLATGICENKYYKDGVLGTGSYNGKRYSEGSLLTGDYKNKFYKNGELYTGMRKSNGKYYVNGELATGSYKNKYYKDGELYTGIYKSKYYKDGVLGTGTCNGKFYKDGELYTGMRKSNGKYYVDGVLANGTYDGVKYVDGVAQSDDSSDKDEEKLTEGEFRTSGGKLQKCQYELANGSVGEFPKLWNFDDGDMIYSDESTFKLSEHPNMKKENGKYYTLAWRDYTGEYESKFYEAGKHVDYKLYSADGKLYTGWCRLNNPSNWEYAKWIHAINEKQYSNLLYVENGVVKQYYVYEGDENHIWCNTCGADLYLSPDRDPDGGIREDKHEENEHPQLGQDSNNGGSVYKYTNNGKTYWVTASNGREYRWTGTEYVPYWNVGGTECLDTSLPKELTHLNDTGKIPDVVYSSDDWKIGQCSIVLVNKDIVLK